MQIVETIVLVLSFVTILTVLIGIHVRMRKEFKVEASWVGVAIVPALIWMITAGQLSEFSGFGLTVKLEDARTKSLSGIAAEGTFKTKPVPVEKKTSRDKIPDYVEQRLEGLSFELGKKGYYVADVIRDYLTTLSDHDFFRYVVFVDGDEKFAGLIPVNTLFEELAQKEQRGLIENRWLYLERVIEGNALGELNGVITASVSKDGSKAEALQEMVGRGLTQLPVVTSDGQFLGVIEQEKLANSILIEFLAQL